MRKWNEVEDKIVRQKYGNTPLADIAKELDRTEWGVRNRACKLGVQSKRGVKKATPKGTAWADTDVRFLRRHYPRCRIEDVAKELGRSVDSVRKKAVRLGLAKDTKAKNTGRVASYKEFRQAIA